MDFGPHAGFILAAYASAAILLSLLAAWLVIDGRRLQRLLDELEAHGVRRRSDRAGSSPGGVDPVGSLPVMLAISLGEHNWRSGAQTLA